MASFFVAELTSRMGAEGGETMADNDFFNKEEEQEEIEKIKVGENEFTTEELQGLVGKAQSLNEFEKKQGQSWDEVVKSWGQRGERIGEYKSENEKLQRELEAFKNPPEEPTKEEVDQEKLKRQVIDEANKYGLMTQEQFDRKFDEYYQQRKAGEKMLNDVDNVINKAKTDGLPETTTEQLLEYMADPANPKDAQKAYNLMFEKELDEIKQKKLMSIKRDEFVTETSGNAGAKEPAPRVAKNANELNASILEHLNASE